jgi:hypothetical protein
MISSNTLLIGLVTYWKIQAFFSFQILQCIKIVTVSKSLRKFFGALFRAYVHQSNVLRYAMPGLGKSALDQLRILLQTWRVKRQWTNM